MNIVAIAGSTIPSDTANSIQVMKACAALAQLGHNLTLIVPGNPQSPVSNLQFSILSGSQKIAFLSFNTSRTTGKSADTIARPAAMYSNIFIGLATLAESAVPLEPMMERL